MNTLTLHDVADLAKVRRPVVSMRRKRPMVRGVSLPSQGPVESVNGIARFDQAEVVDWLTRTGRGSNTQHKFDASANAVPDNTDLEEVVTRLCWHVRTGGDLDGSTIEERVRRADEFDPDDAVIAREIRRVTASNSARQLTGNCVAAR